jgi:hypothetical protein
MTFSAKNVPFDADIAKNSAALRGNHSFLRDGIKEHRVDKIFSGGSALLINASTLADNASWRASNLLLRAITFISGQHDLIIVNKSMLWRPGSSQSRRRTIGQLSLRRPSKV